VGRGTRTHVLLLAAALGACHERKADTAPPPPVVKAAVVLQRDVPVTVEAIGELRGNTEIEVLARVEGFIESIDFAEGTVVKKGQQLYSIDSAPFVAQLAQAQGGEAEAEAQRVRTHQDVVRYEPLVAKNAISREEYETAVALEKAAKASLDAAKALTERAQINLSYTKVLSPDDGLVGKTEVDVGALVGGSHPALLTRVSRIDPIDARFSIAEKDYLYYARKSGGQIHAGDPTPFRIVLADGTTHPETGRLSFLDSTVDPRTGTILMDVAFPNPVGLLRPGQYARVRAEVDVKKGALLVPQRAVQEQQGVFSVMVVKSDDTVEQRMVKPAERYGPLWVIDSGLQPGDRVVVEGMQKARPGSKVQVEAVTIEDPDKPQAAAPAPAPTPASPPAADGAR
jgi:membrane fusion protein (multidrug efflux system)